jgi:hypothetical protein
MREKRAALDGNLIHKWQICYIVSATLRRALQNLVISGSYTERSIWKTLPYQHAELFYQKRQFNVFVTTGPVFCARHSRIITKCECSYKFYKNYCSEKNYFLGFHFFTKKINKIFSNDDRITWKYFCKPVYLLFSCRMSMDNWLQCKHNFYKTFGKQNIFCDDGNQNEYPHGFKTLYWSCLLSDLVNRQRL